MKNKFILSFILALVTGLSFGQSWSGTDLTQSAKWVKFSPNPASNFIMFDVLRNSENGNSLQIYNFMGRKIHEIKNFNSHTFIDLQRYYRGVYIYQIRNRKGYVLESGKFQIVK